MTIIGAMLAGWSSANKYSLLGALRAGSQMISYELIMAMTLLGLIFIYGTIDLDEIVRYQSGVVGSASCRRGGVCCSRSPPPCS